MWYAGVAENVDISARNAQKGPRNKPRKRSLEQYWQQRWYPRAQRIWQRTLRSFRVESGPPGAGLHRNVSYSEFPLFLDSLDEKDFVQAGSPLDIGQI